MKALIITNLTPTISNNHSGIFIIRRLQYYKRYGINFDVIVPKFKDTQLVKFLKKFLDIDTAEILKKSNGIEFKPIALQQNLFSFLLRIVMPHNFLKAARAFSEKIEKEFDVEDYDIIHAHGMYDAAAGAIAKFLAKKYKKPFVITLHRSDINMIMPLRKKQYINILESSSANIFVSKALLEKAKSFGYSGKNAFVIPNGYDESIFKPNDKIAIQKELGIYKKGYKYVGFVGNLIPIKRADKLGKIFNQIAKMHPKTHFIVVGDGKLKEKIKKETEGLSIIFTGRIPQEEVAKYMNAMDVMILPSRSEGFGAVVIESQACETCVIGSNNGGIPEAIGFPEYIVKEGKLFEMRFAEKVVEVLQQGYDKKMLINRAKEYLWKNIVKEEISLYSRILKGE